MPGKDKFFKYIYSSAPLTEEHFAALKHDGIFKNYFADNPFRKPILEKLEKSLAASQGGVFLVSGYRGIGKTTFLNYVLNNLKETHHKAKLNLSEIKYDFKLELIAWMAVVIKEAFEEELKKQRRHMFYGQVNFIKYKCCQIKGFFTGKDAEYGKDKIINLMELKEECDDIFESVFFEREREMSHSMDIGWDGTGGSIKAGRQGKKKVREKKEDLFFYEYRLKELLKKVYERKIFSKRFVFVLDELDKVPASSVKAIRKDEGDVAKKDENPGDKYQKMEWLLKMLSDIKSFFFESGAVFVLVVNKDVYDCWKYRHSQEDLFMNLVTNVEYLPSYTKEEMELSLEFPLSLAEDVDISYPFSPFAIKKYFQMTMYYESYGNPRLYFQNLSKKLKNEEIRISRDQARYLRTKSKLFELNELIYNYVHVGNEQNFGRFLFGIDEISNVFKQIHRKKDEYEQSKGKGPEFRHGDAKNQPVKMVDFKYDGDLASLFAAYYDCLGDNKDNLLEFWRSDISTTRKDRHQESKSIQENPVYNKFEAFLTILKQHDGQENYPCTNYVIRRLTDFLRIIEEKHFVSIENIYEELNLQKFETTDTVGRYFINLLIPLSIVILRNNGTLNIHGKYLHYTFDYISSVHCFHEGCEAEFNGDFSQALKDYNKFLKADPVNLDAHHRKLRLLYYMMKLGHYDEKIDVKAQWFDSLQKMKQCFSEENEEYSDDWRQANYLFLARYYFVKILKGDAEDRKRCRKLLELASDPESSTIERIYSRAIERDPMNANIKMWKGYFLMHEGRNVAALDLFQDALKDYTEPLTLIREAYAHSCLENKEEAKRLYLKAFRLTTSWSQKASIVIHLSKLNVSIGKKDVFWHGLKEFSDDLVQKLRSKDESFNCSWQSLGDFKRVLAQKLASNDAPLNYYCVFKALYVLHNDLNKDGVPLAKFNKDMDAIVDKEVSANGAKSAWYKMMKFYFEKTF